VCDPVTSVKKLKTSKSGSTLTRLAHGALDVERANVLPRLLEERDEEVDGKHHVGDDLVVGHLDVANGDTEAEDLLELELDRALDLGELLLEVIGVRHGRGELAGYVGACVSTASSVWSERTHPWTDRDPADGESA
jgi:hypothetical protein